jgi:hypothetical protein
MSDCSYCETEPAVISALYARGEYVEAAMHQRLLDAHKAQHKQGDVVSIGGEGYGASTVYTMVGQEVKRGQ